MVIAETQSSAAGVDERSPEYRGQPRLFRENRIVTETILAGVPVKFVESFCWIDEDSGVQVMFDVFDIETTSPMVDEDHEPF